MEDNQSKPLSELQIGPCKVKVIQGFIQHCKEEAVVNSTNESCDFQQNASAKALAEAAGPGLKAECSKFGKLLHGEVRHSDAYNLQCKKVLHVWMGQLDSKSPSEKDFGRIITECLCVVDQDLMLSSVAFPALGTGVLKFSADFVARCFMRSLKGFTSHYDVRHLREITIVILPSDTIMYQTFTAVFGEHSTLLNAHFMDELFGSIELLKTLDRDSEEFLEVEASFKRSLKKAVTVSEITRVQNFSQWTIYKQRRSQVSTSLNKSSHDVERLLYHVTLEETVEEIVNHGFSRQHNDGKEFGKGSYFTIDIKNALLSRTEEKSIIRARVIVGEFMKGEKTFKDPPKKDSDNKYDSVVDNVQNPTTFVVFHDAAAYPEYIIKYKS